MPGGWVAGFPEGNPGCALLEVNISWCCKAPGHVFALLRTWYTAPGLCTLTEMDRWGGIGRRQDLAEKEMQRCGGACL